MIGRVWSSLIVVSGVGAVVAVGLQRSVTRSSKMPPKAVASTSRVEGKLDSTHRSLLDLNPVGNLLLSGGRNSSPKKAGECKLQIFLIVTKRHMRSWSYQQAKSLQPKDTNRPDKLPTGFEIEDKMSKRTWKIGEMIGQGGFADVYSGKFAADLKITTFQLLERLLGIQIFTSSSTASRKNNIE